MLNYIWSFMIIFSIFIAAFSGGMQEVTTSALNASQAAVKLCIEMCGIVSLWMGVMRIAEKAKLIDALASKMTPLLDFLFPDVPRYHPARKYIATNLIANFLGLGWAATPPGLKAMTELQKLNKEKHRASHAMCMFLIVNISCVQLVAINMISYRASYGSANPTEIIAPCILATLMASSVAILFAKLMYRKEH
ncbi:nucleoside recognition protein [Sporanaerobium hydrogeniformans]|uniref:Nucleoside recognition protein n=1 Tax=Sporanaerobium hydrogeniformans TaxID=3072179 RepID=A0AC61DCD6_9FIRM|nr:nucleoside recognition protein [Sporanaerobium hydrogeniformans]PHV70207.1 nucleoside recognition protein [Sporanaerobium hydrogeniformans]